MITAREIIKVVAEEFDLTMVDMSKATDVPLSFHPAATRVLGLVTPRSVG